MFLQCHDNNAIGKPKTFVKYVINKQNQKKKLTINETYQNLFRCLLRYLFIMMYVKTYIVRYNTILNDIIKKT